jgi:hypothetical protein
MDLAQRAFVDGLLARASAARPPDHDAHVRFRSRIIDRWDEIVLRVEGKLAATLRGLPHTTHRCLRALEDSRSLLGPLGRAEDEVTHTRALAWALSRNGTLGTTLRATFARLVAAEVPADGWRVRAESGVGPGCRVDVNVHLPGVWRCFIEAKILAGERPSQLADYRRQLDARRGPEEVTTLVFLTLEADQPHSGVPFEPLTWRTLAATWLPLVLGPEPDAAWLRGWLAGIITDLYHAADDGPFPTWDTGTRIRALDLLRDAVPALEDQ